MCQTQAVVVGLTGPRVHQINVGRPAVEGRIIAAADVLDRLVVRRQYHQSVLVVSFGLVELRVERVVIGEPNFLRVGMAIQFRTCQDPLIPFVLGRKRWLRGSEILTLPTRYLVIAGIQVT